MKDNSLGHKQHEYLSTISENSHILLSQINHILSDSIEENIPDRSVTDIKPVKKILVVDDVSINRMILKIMLQRHSYDVSVAENGKEALEIINREQPDLILMDIMMPVMDGIETVKTLRSYNNHISNIPVIAVTANSIKTNYPKLVEAGFDDFLQKPFREEELLKLIEA